MTGLQELCHVVLCYVMSCYATLKEGSFDTSGFSIDGTSTSGCTVLHRWEAAAAASSSPPAEWSSLDTAVRAPALTPCTPSSRTCHTHAQSASQHPSHTATQPMKRKERKEKHKETTGPNQCKGSGWGRVSESGGGVDEGH